MGKIEFESLMTRVRDMQARGALPRVPNDEQRADWAYGQAVIENDDVTREMATSAVATTPGAR